MKTFVSLVLTLWSFVGLAQTTIKTAVIAPAPGKSGTAYTVSYERNWQTYPPTTSGLSSLTTAIAEGKLKLTVSGSGCVIAAGTRPPTSAPTCNNASGLPILYANSGLTSKYTYSSDNNGTLQIRATGLSSAQIKLETVSGQTLTLSNSQNSTIPYNSFVGYGNSGDSSYPFDWTFWGVPQVPIKVSMKTSGSADVATFTPVVGSDQPLSGAGGTTPPTNPVKTITYRPINTIVVEANSIGFYPTNVGVGWPNNWGMAASAENKDFFHILRDSVRAIYPNINMFIWGKELGISVAEGGYFEQDYDRLGDGLHRYDTLSRSAPDVLITRLGENVTEVRSTFQKAWKDQIDRVTIHSTNPIKLITTSVWGNSTVDAALITLANNNGWPLVDLRGISGSRDGILNHPTDAAHAEYAKRIWAKLKASLATGTVTTPGTSTTAVAGNVDSQGFLIYQDQGWSGADIKRIENSEMFLEFKRSVGACVTGAGLKSNNRNVVNDEQVRPDGVNAISDKGVQWQVSPYAFPSGGQTLTIGNQSAAGTGDNPVQGGSANPYFQPGVVEKSAIIQTADRGVVFCARIRGLLWDWYSVPGHMPADIEWWFLPGNVITYKVRLTIEPRPSNWSGEQKFQSLSQELLCLYNIGAFNTHVAQVNGQEISLRDGVPLGGQSNDYFTSGCWAATYSPDRSQGVLYYTPRNAIFKSWQKVAESGEWPDPGMSYINASVKRTYDIAGTQTIDNGYIILGSQSSAMARMAQLEPIDQSFDFDFTSPNNHWWNEDARVTRESSGLLKWWVGDPNHDVSSINTGKMLSPVRAWQASNFQNVEFTMAVSGTAKLNLKWGKPGKFGQVEYRTAISVTGDGTERTYQFNLSNLPNWNGTISYLGLEADLNINNQSAYVLLRRARKFGTEGVGEFLLLSLAAGTALRRTKKPLAVRRHKPIARLRLGVGSLAALALAFILSGCQTTRPVPGMPTPSQASIQVLIDNDSIPTAERCFCPQGPDSLRHQPK